MQYKVGIFQCLVPWRGQCLKVQGTQKMAENPQVQTVLFLGLE